MTTLLQRELGCPAVLELGGDIDREFHIEELLRVYYEDKRRWGFTMQVAFLNSRLAKIAQVMRDNADARIILFDRYFDTDYVVAKYLADIGDISKMEFEIYYRHYLTVRGFVRTPDASVVLRTAPERALERIRSRNRGNESTFIDTQYLHDLRQGFREHIDALKASGGVVYDHDVDNVTKAEMPELAGRIAAQIRKDFG